MQQMKQGELFGSPRILILFLFCYGIGLVLSALAVYFRDVTHLYGVVTLAWMYITPIFYDISRLPEFVRSVIGLNPMYHFITFFRDLILYGVIPGINTWLACVGCSVVVLGLGLLLFHKLQKNFILHI